MPALPPRLVSNFYLSLSPSCSPPPLLPSLLRLVPPGRLLAAYTDEVYQRSSLHLCSTCPDELAAIVAALVRALAQSPAAELPPPDPGGSAHPRLSLIDNISLMSTESPDPPALAALRAAHQGILELTKGLPKHQFSPLAYGHAHPAGYRELRDVRRESGFFSSPAAAPSAAPGAPPPPALCTLGVPDTFITNYNIRLSFPPPLSPPLLRAPLSRAARASAPGVEALTLPYGPGRLEVACNLVHPPPPEPPTPTAPLLAAVRGALEGGGGEVEVHAYAVGVTQEQVLAHDFGRSNPEGYTALHGGE
ncbi:hypothetical protein TeGR_g11639 [Tetraparma gracilis]|uniref:Uncharacterized protein n=1 Tax=Tetraparma gracilis TaxID=2962635 RepID=A0ABQ6MAK6_9STRA|nr:hypothetical protein TeGR_g11639 [Tetraparma gracilis]